MKLNDKYQKMILAALLIFCYQLAYGRNEWSYKCGFKIGFGQYQCPITDDCDQPIPDAAKLTCINPTPQMVHVTNSTACLVGYVNGWKHLCQTDMC
jgi:hypothetical protein